MTSVEVMNLDKEGFHIFGEIIDKDRIQNLYDRMLSARSFGPNLFLSESEYFNLKNHFNTNPSPQFNFLNQFKDELSMIEENKGVTSTLKDVLGDDYQIVIKKAVCGVPESWIPAWVNEKINGVNVANLGPYLKKEFRDITYFRGIDFHQDIIDWPEGSTDLDPSTFLTLYIYLHDVDEFDSPLHILPCTHRFGSTLFPHSLKRTGEQHWEYRDDKGNLAMSKDTTLTGGAGFVGLWHNCLLHGTQPLKHESEKFRLSLRYLIAKSNSNKKITEINRINNNISGILSPLRTRKDLDDKGKAKIRGNTINSI